MANEPRERRFIAEYMLKTFPFGNYVLNVPLGRIPDDILARYGQTAGAQLARPQRPRIDAVAWDKNTYWLIEAKIREAKAAIGDLLVYRSLADKTLDLPNYDGQIFKMRLVVPWALDWILTAAHAHDQQVDIFLPQWVEEYVRSRQNYFTAEHRIARAEKMRLRKTLGVE
jgi:hypothetical protein